MNRKEKYPDTATFHYYNANPKNKLTTDCVIRAICTATTFSYEKVLRDLTELQIKTGYDMSDELCYGKYLKSLGWRKQKQPRKWDNTKYTGEQFCDQVMRYDNGLGEGDYEIHRIIAHIGGGHIVAIMSGQVWDTWDSTSGCIGNWWTKEVI